MRKRALILYQAQVRFLVWPADGDHSSSMLTTSNVRIALPRSLFLLKRGLVRLCDGSLGIRQSQQITGIDRNI